MVSKKRTAIMESVLRLLEERPLNKITVKDIVDECGINRNTFYYHFEDISSLIEAIIISEVDRVMTQYRDISSLEECMEMAMRLVSDHKNAIYHIYNSSNRDFLERRLMEICRYVAGQFVERSAEVVFAEEDGLVIGFALPLLIIIELLMKVMFDLFSTSAKLVILL